MKRIYSIFVTLFLMIGLVLPNFTNVALAAGESAKTITIFHTNDMHGRLVSSTNSSKVLTTIGADYVKAIKESVPNSILVDAGDATQGLPFANISKGADVIKLMNAAGYDGMALGNHEFDFGKDVAIENARNANFPVVSANATYNGKPILEGINKGNGKNFIKEVDGVKVGFFGITTEETAYKTNPKNIEGVKFENPITTSESQVKELKAQGAQVVVGVMHIGNDSSSDPTSEKIAKSVTGLDVLIDGHSHTLENTEINGTLIVQTEAHSVKIGKVEVQVDNGKVISKKAEMLNAADVPNKFKADETVKALATKIVESQQVFFNKVVGRTMTSLWGGTVNGKSVGRITETNLGNLIADSMIYGAKSQVKGSPHEKKPIVSLENGGGIRETIPAGYITRGQVISVLPFGNILSLKVVTPNVLYEVLENGVSKIDKVDPTTGVISGADGRYAQIGGMRFEYDYTKEAANTDPKKPPLKKGERVTKVVLLNEDGTDGKVLDRNDTTTEIVLASNDFEVAGGDGYTMLKDLKNIGEGNALDVIFEDYIKKLTSEGKGIFDVPARKGRSKALTPYEYKSYKATITVKNSDGAVANKELVYSIDKKTNGKATTNQNGELVINDIPSGPHSVTITDGNLAAETYINDIIDVFQAPAVLSDIDPIMAKAVTNLISDLPAVIELKDEEQVQHVSKAYDELTEAQKKLVTNYKVLEDAMKQLSKLRAERLVKAIDALPAEITLADQEAVLAALKLFNGLTDAEKELVPNYTKLTAASEKIIELLMKDKQDREAAQIVITLIDGLPQKITSVADRKAVAAAREAYDKLTPDQKKLVHNYSKLQAAEKQIKPPVVAVKSVSLSKTKATIHRGKSLQLVANVNPSNAVNKQVTWSSSNPKVAVVDARGKVTAKKAGKAIITVKTVSGAKTAKAAVTVVEPVKSVQLNKKSVTLNKGKTYTLKAKINPANATNKKVTWSSSKTSVATVDKNGKVTAKGKGTAVITVKTSDGGKKAVCKTTVK